MEEGVVSLAEAARCHALAIDLEFERNGELDGHEFDAMVRRVSGIGSFEGANGDVEPWVAALASRTVPLLMPAQGRTSGASASGACPDALAGFGH